MERNMDNIDNEISVSEQYPELFHYTKVSLFENIYKTKEFWAGHYEDSNDSTEFARFRLRVNEFIRPIIWGSFDKKMLDSPEDTKKVKRDGGIDFLVNKEVEMFLDDLHRHTFGKGMFKDTFVSSFCAHDSQSYESKHGLLSQWRGYGADGGVAIVFDTLSVDKILRHEFNVFDYQIMFISDVTYDSTDNYTRIRGRFKKVFELFPELLEEFYKEKEIEPYLEKMLKHFVLGSTLVKHHAFHEENEIRIVVSPTTKDSFQEHDESKQPKKIHHTQKEGRKIQYIILNENSPLPTIKRIIVGPSRSQDQNYQKIMKLVKSSNIKIEKSTIPFVGR